MNDDLGDRMKMYERIEAGRVFMPLVPIVARIDGRCFSSFTRGMERPYDEALSHTMIDTTRFMVQETNACMGYTQSDEITLAWHSTDIKSEIFFGGRVCKMVSQLAALTTLDFYLRCRETLAPYAHRRPTFDARVWTVPNRTEAANVFLWREWDATKNSIQMAAQEHYSHHQLHSKNGREQQEMLFQKGINWNDYPTFFKRGTFVQRRMVSKPFSAEELERLPEKHHARTNPDLLVERSEWMEIEMPIFSTVENREAVVFDGSAPIKGTAP